MTYPQFANPVLEDFSCLKFDFLDAEPESGIWVQGNQTYKGGRKAAWKRKRSRIRMGYWEQKVDLRGGLKF